MSLFIDAPTASPTNVPAEIDSNNGMHGIMDTVIFDNEFTPSEASDTVHIITNIMKQRLINVLPATCIQDTPFDTSYLNTINNYDKIHRLTVNLSAIVCNKVQQQQLVSLSDTKNIHIRCEMIHTVHQQLGLFIPFNATFFETIAITQYPTTTTEYIKKSDNDDGDMFGESDDIATVLFIIIGTLASASILIACAILIMNSNASGIKKRISEQNQRNAGQHDDSFLDMEGSKLKYKYSTTVESESDFFGEINLRTLKGDGKMETIVEYEQECSEEYEPAHKYSCSCHGGKDIYATNDGVLLEYDEALGAMLPTHTSPHPHVTDGSSELNLDFLRETVPHEDGCELWKAMQHNLNGQGHTLADMQTTMEYVDELTKGNELLSDGEDAFVMSPHHAMV